uniref:Uncharacterized protein n=1 Tax=Zea mays TaxID=4577 RepID=A0A804PEE0_MAIZE
MLLGVDKRRLGQDSAAMEEEDSGGGDYDTVLKAHARSGGGDYGTVLKAHARSGASDVGGQLGTGGWTVFSVLKECHSISLCWTRVLEVFLQVCEEK